MRCNRWVIAGGVVAILLIGIVAAVNPARIALEYIDIKKSCGPMELHTDSGVKVVPLCHFYWKNRFVMFEKDRLQQMKQDEPWLRFMK